MEHMWSSKIQYYEVEGLKRFDIMEIWLFDAGRYQFKFLPESDSLQTFL